MNKSNLCRELQKIVNANQGGTEMNITTWDMLKSIEENNFYRPAIINNEKIKFSFINNKTGALEFMGELTSSDFISNFDVDFVGSQNWVTVSKSDLYLYLERGDNNAME